MVKEVAERGSLVELNGMNILYGCFTNKESKEFLDKNNVPYIPIAYSKNINSGLIYSQSGFYQYYLRIKLPHLKYGDYPFFKWNGLYSSLKNIPLLEKEEIFSKYFGKINRQMQIFFGGDRQKLTDFIFLLNNSNNAIFGNIITRVISGGKDLNIYWDKLKLDQDGHKKFENYRENLNDMVKLLNLGEMEFPSEYALERFRGKPFFEIGMDYIKLNKADRKNFLKGVQEVVEMFKYVSFFIKGHNAYCDPYIKNFSKDMREKGLYHSVKFSYYFLDVLALYLSEYLPKVLKEKSEDKHNEALTNLCENLQLMFSENISKLKEFQFEIKDFSNNELDIYSSLENSFANGKIDIKTFSYEKLIKDFWLLFVLGRKIEDNNDFIQFSKSSFLNTIVNSIKKEIDKYGNNFLLELILQYGLLFKKKKKEKNYEVQTMSDVFQVALMEGMYNDDTIKYMQKLIIDIESYVYKRYKSLNVSYVHAISEFHAQVLFFSMISRKSENVLFLLSSDFGIKEKPSYDNYVRNTIVSLKSKIIFNQLSEFEIKDNFTFNKNEKNSVADFFEHINNIDFNQLFAQLGEEELQLWDSYNEFSEKVWGENPHEILSNKKNLITTEKLYFSDKEIKKSLKQAYNYISVYGFSLKELFVSGKSDNILTESKKYQRSLINLAYFNLLSDTTYLFSQEDKQIKNNKNEKYFFFLGDNNVSFQGEKNAIQFFEMIGFGKSVKFIKSFECDGKNFANKRRGNDGESLSAEAQKFGFAYDGLVFDEFAEKDFRDWNNIKESESVSEWIYQRFAWKFPTRYLDDFGDTISVFKETSLDTYAVYYHKAVQALLLENKKKNFVKKDIVTLPQLNILFDVWSSVCHLGVHSLSNFLEIVDYFGCFEGLKKIQGLIFQISLLDQIKFSMGKKNFLKSYQEDFFKAFKFSFTDEYIQLNTQEPLKEFFKSFVKKQKKFFTFKKYESDKNFKNEKNEKNYVDFLVNHTHFISSVLENISTKLMALFICKNNILYLRKLYDFQIGDKVLLVKRNKYGVGVNDQEDTFFYQNLTHLFKKSEIKISQLSKTTDKLSDNHFHIVSVGFDDLQNYSFVLKKINWKKIIINLNGEYHEIDSNYHAIQKVIYSCGYENIDKIIMNTQLLARPLSNIKEDVDVKKSTFSFKHGSENVHFVDKIIGKKNFCVSEYDNAIQFDPLLFEKTYIKQIYGLFDTFFAKFYSKFFEKSLISFLKDFYCIDDYISEVDMRNGFIEVLINELAQFEKKVLMAGEETIYNKSDVYDSYTLLGDVINDSFNEEKIILDTINNEALKAIQEIERNFDNFCEINDVLIKEEIKKIKPS